MVAAPDKPKNLCLGDCDLSLGLRVTGTSTANQHTTPASGEAWILKVTRVTSPGAAHQGSCPSFLNNISPPNPTLRGCFLSVENPKETGE